MDGIKNYVDGLIKNLKERFDFEIYEISNAYSMILKYSNKGDEQCSEIVAYYSNLIKNYIEECYKEISKETNINFINCFIYYTERIYSFIYLLKKIFYYLDRFYTKKHSRYSLSEISLNLYYANFFNRQKNKIFEETNKLLIEDRKWNKINRDKKKR